MESGWICSDATAAAIAKTRTKQAISRIAEGTTLDYSLPLLTVVHGWSEAAPYTVESVYG